MLDYRDIVDYVLVVFKKKRLEAIPENEVWSISDIVERASLGEPISAQAVSDLSHKNPFYSVLLESTLMDVAKLFGESRGIHRVNVVDEAGRVQGIISQSDLGRHLFGRKAELKPFFDKSVLLGTGLAPLIVG